MLFVISEYCLCLYSTAAVPCAVVKLHIVTGVQDSLCCTPFIGQNTPYIIFFALIIFKIGLFSVILKNIFMYNNFISLERKGHMCAHKCTHT